MQQDVQVEVPCREVFGPECNLEQLRRVIVEKKDGNNVVPTRVKKCAVSYGGIDTEMLAAISILGNHKERLAYAGEKPVDEVNMVGVRQIWRQPTPGSPVN